jgi:hypothetical protein
MSSNPFRIRDAVEADSAFVKSAWRGTFRTAGHGVEDADPEHYHREMQRIFDRLLPSATVRVACDPDDADSLIGFIAATGDELHYAYVKQDFRKLGVVPAMLEGLDIRRFTFKTQPGERRMRPKTRGWLFTPRFTL